MIIDLKSDDVFKGKKKYVYTQNQKKSVEISETGNKETGLGEFETHRAYMNQMNQMETLSK